MGGARRVRGVLLLGAAWALFTLWGGAAAQEQGTITGRLIGKPAKGSVEGTTVVLLWFRSDEQGKPTGGPLSRQVAGKDGSYVFADVPIDPKARYQLGARVGGNLVGSDSFTFAPGKKRVTVDLKIPDLSTDASALRIGQALFALEPRPGLLAVTEAIHLENPTASVIDLREQPIELPIPSAAEQLEMLRFDVQEGSHEQLGAKLLVFGKLRPGANSVAFRYRMSAGLGSVHLTKSYPFQISEVLVLSPDQALAVDGIGLEAQPPRTIQKQTYAAWSRANVPPGAQVVIRASGIPVQQALYLLPLAGFFVVMAGVVIWFFRKRLGAASRG
jgi:hypothetical protein